MIELLLSRPRGFVLPMWLARPELVPTATEIFPKGGYLGTNMDEIAAASGVSKQTVDKHFVSMEALFIEIVTSMTNRAGDLGYRDMPDLGDEGDVVEYLQEYAVTQLGVVLTPRVMQLRRLVMAEPANRAMLLGDEAIPNDGELRLYAAEGVRTFLAAYGAR